MAETMDKDIQALRKDIDKLKADLKAAADTGGDLMESARGKLEAEAEKLMAGLRSAAGEVGENVRSFAGDVAGQGEEMFHRVEDHVGRHPTQSVLVSFGAGFVIGWLLSRK